jgi:hypothetical protein
MGTNQQVKYAHANDCFFNSAKAGVPVHEGRLCAEKGLLTLKSECPVSGSGFQITIAKQFNDL